MKSILLMGKFGQTLGERFLSMGDEVMIVDKNESIINALAPKYTGALIANCMNADSLATMDIPSFDICVVAIGDDFQSSLEITSLLKDLGAKYVVSKATTEIQRKFLLRNGADEVIYPQMDMAYKAAIKYNANNIFDFIKLGNDYGIFEIKVPREWVGKDVVRANIRKEYALNVLAVKKGNADAVYAAADYVFQEDDHVIVAGAFKSVDRLKDR